MAILNLGTALVLGGTSGLGLELALQCRDSCYGRVIVAGRHDPRREGNQDRNWNSVEFKHCDLTSWDLAIKLTGELQEVGVFPSMFIWAAAQHWMGHFSDMKMRQMKELAVTNMVNALPIVQWAWDRMRDLRSQRTRFVIISSTSATKPRNQEAIYAGTKAFQLQLARCLAKEHPYTKRTVTVALPGGMKTQLYREGMNPHYKEFMDPGKVARFIMERVMRQRCALNVLKIPRQKELM